VDPSPDQWQGILRVVQERRLMPFFDSAYQVRGAACIVCVWGGVGGFGEGVGLN